MEKESKPKYKVTVDILGKKVKTEGETIEDCLSKFDLGWENIKNKGVVTVSKGNQSHEHLFNIKVLRRIFSNKIVRAHWAKNLELLLKENVKTNIPK